MLLPAGWIRKGEELKAQVRQHWLFRFDWFIKSRTPKELSRRIETLINLVEKEFEEQDMGAKRLSGGGGGGDAKKAKAEPAACASDLRSAT